MKKSIIIGIILLISILGMVNAYGNTPQFKKSFTCLPFSAGKFTTNINTPYCIISNSTLQISNYSNSNIVKTTAPFGNYHIYYYIFSYKGIALIKDITGNIMTLKIVNPIEQQMQITLAEKINQLVNINTNLTSQVNNLSNYNKELIKNLKLNNVEMNKLRKGVPTIIYLQGGSVNTYLKKQNKNLNITVNILIILAIIAVIMIILKLVKYRNMWREK